MRYCIGNLTEKQVAVLRRTFEDAVRLYQNTLAELTDQTVEEPRDVAAILEQLRAPIAQDEVTGEVMSALEFGEDDVPQSFDDFVGEDDEFGEDDGE